MASLTIATALAEIRNRIAAAATRAGRDPASVTLVAVSKKVASARIAEAAQAGITCFGESYVQEALAKQQDPVLADAVLNWHYIGHLQRNKARDVVGRFELLHGVDSITLARAIGERGQESGLVAAILLQVKLDPNPNKFGISLDDVAETVEAASRIPGIEVVGLMGIPPPADDPEAARAPFRELRSQFLALPPEMRKVLSMGMSGDFEVAVEEGATHVRIGTALFGPRMVSTKAT